MTCVAFNHSNTNYDDYKALTHWAEANGLDAHDWEGLCSNKKVESEVLSSLTAVARKSQLKSFEVVKAVILRFKEQIARVKR